MEAFGRVLRVPHVLWLFTSALLARLPYGIEGLGIVLFVQAETDSFAAAGIVSAAYAVAAGAGLPVLGRVIDAIGQTRVLIAAGLVHLASGAALIALGLEGAPTGVLAAVAVVSGFAVPPVSPALRSLWPDVLGDDPAQLRTALALDAITLEFVWIGGPLIAAVLVAVASPQVALGFGFALSAVGAAAFASSGPSRRWRGAGTGVYGLGPLRSPGLLTLLCTAVPVGWGLGALEVGLPAFGVSEGNRGLGALAVAALSLGSAVGGLVYGARPPQRLIPAFLVYCVLLPVGVALLALPGSLVAMLLLAPLAGVALAPFTAASNELVGTVAPEGTVTEAYAWVITATIVGVALGTAVCGAVIEAASWREAMLVGGAGGLTGAVLAFARRGTLRPTA